MSKKRVVEDAVVAVVAAPVVVPQEVRVAEAIGGTGIVIGAKVWQQQRPKAIATALLAWLGETSAPKKRTLSEWDALYAAFLRAPAKR